MEPLFLTVDEVLEIHEEQIERYGGSSGLRDAAALESAVATPQATFGGEFLHTSIPAMAAAYLYHLCQNHPFTDGKKRVGANGRIRHRSEISIKIGAAAVVIGTAIEVSERARNPAGCS